MASVTQNKQVPYFQCGPLKNVKKKKNQEGFSENNRDSKADCK